MDVGVKAERLCPGVQDGDNAGSGSEVPPTDVVQGFPGGGKEHLEALAAVIEEKGVQRWRHCEDDVEVGNGEQVLTLRSDPSGLVEALALWAVPVPTGVVEGLLAAAVVAHLQVPAEDRRAAQHDVTDRPASIAAETAWWRRVRCENVR